MRVLFLRAISNVKSTGIYVSSLQRFNNKGCTVNRNIVYADGPKGRLDVYRPKLHERSSKLPILLVIHGGGWVLGDKRGTANYCVALALHGYIVCSINYRLAPEHPYPAAVADSMLALKWMHEHAKSFGGDPSRIYIIGESSGAHISGSMFSDTAAKEYDNIHAATALKNVKGLVLYYGAYNLRSLERVKRPLIQTYLNAFLPAENAAIRKTALDRASPVKHIARHFPSVLLISSECDPLHDQSIELYELLRNKKLNARLYSLDIDEYPDAKHGFMLFPGSKAGRVTIKAVTEFISAEGN